jgi:hypothetical protein
MRKKVDKTIKADWGLPSHRTVAQPRVAASSRANSSFPPPVYDDTVALSREVASLRHPPAYDDTVAQSRSGSLGSRIPPGFFLSFFSFFLTSLLPVGRGEWW